MHPPWHPGSLGQCLLSSHLQLLAEQRWLYLPSMFSLLLQHKSFLWALGDGGKHLEPSGVL